VKKGEGISLVLFFRVDAKAQLSFYVQQGYYRHLLSLEADNYLMEVVG
jgi:hypothetical protein